jgi:AcrR family transcriptional regulator
MVSYYFGSKERLLESLIFYRTKDLKIQIENLLIEDLDPIAKINKLIEIYINRINSIKEFSEFCILKWPKKNELNIKSFMSLRKVT